MIDESYLSEVHSHSKDNEQVTFQEYTNTETGSLGTTIAVVTEPTGGITEVCDEFIPELGMPKGILNEFRKVRSNIESTDDVTKHNKAAAEVNIEEKYRSYLKNNVDANEQVESLCDRIVSGEKITLVCFEKEPKWCHRHILKQEIEKRISKTTEK